MSLKSRLEDDLKQAMRAREATALQCIRMLRSRLQEREVALRGKLGKDYTIDDEEALKVITTYAKQRRESIASFREAGRDELAEQEQGELEIVERYLPAQMSDDDLTRLVDAVIAETGASGPRDMGAVMRLAIERAGGAADGKRVSKIARERLG